LNIKQNEDYLMKRLNKAKDINDKIDILRKLAQYKNKSSLDVMETYSNHEHEYVREAVAELLSRYKNERSKCLLREALNDKSSFVRKAAVESLGILRDENSISHLLRLLEDKDEIVRIEVVESIGIIGDVKAEKPLINVMKNDKSSLVRGCAAIALSDIESKKAKNAIKEQLKIESQGHSKLRMNVALYMMGEEEALFDILIYLKSRYYRLRCAAVNSLSCITNDENKNTIMDAIAGLQRKEKTRAVKSSINDFLECHTLMND